MYWLSRVHNASVMARSAKFLTGLTIIWIGLCADAVACVVAWCCACGGRDSKH